MHNAIEAAHRYVVQVSDTTMLPIATSLPGQKKATPINRNCFNELTEQR